MKEQSVKYKVNLAAKQLFSHWFVAKTFLYLLDKVQWCARLCQGQAYLCKFDATIASLQHILHWDQFNNTLHVSVLQHPYVQAQHHYLHYMNIQLEILLSKLGSIGKFWCIQQLLKKFGNFWYILATFGTFWQLLVLFGNNIKRLLRLTSGSYLGLNWICVKSWGQFYKYFYTFEKIYNCTQSRFLKI